MQKGTFADWDQYELQGQEEPDYFAKYDSIGGAGADNYGSFMTQEEFTCDEEVVWSTENLAQLHNDKTARGDIFRDAKAYGDSL